MNNEKPTKEFLLKNIKRYSWGTCIKKDYPEFYDFVKNKYPNTEFMEALWLYYEGLDESSKPTCPVCGKPLPFIKFIKGYKSFCSRECAWKGTREKAKKTMIERYGGVGYASPKTREKIINTNIERYGCKCGLQNVDVREKAKKTNLERYGAVSPMQSEIVKEKTKRTMLERYGVEHALQSEQLLNKSKQTRKNHFGEKLHRKLKIVEKKPQKTKVKYYITNNQNTLIVHPNIKIFIKELLDKYNIEYKSNNRSIIGSKELDIYIPSKNLAIECNGCYWHSELKKPNNSYHIAKMRECEKLGIQLIQIWEDWIIHKSEIVKSLVLSKLGIYKDRIYARKCTLREVPMDECANFLENNHLQGSVNGSIRLGLYRDNDELVSIMVLGKKRKSVNGISSDDTYELYRYCNKKNAQVIGGASKLFNHFIKKYNPTQIESFSSNDISRGDLYKVLGFKKDLKISKSYWYINSTMHRIHRYSLRKSELIKLGFDPSLSESQITESMGLLRIYDSGQSKWIWVNKITQNT